jgi:hypothetical protein
MGSELGGTLLLVVLVVVLLLLGKRRLEKLDPSGLATRLRHELGDRMPVYSAETTAGNEAEFTRERLPKRFPWLLLFGVIVLAGALAWWVTR